MENKIKKGDVVYIYGVTREVMCVDDEIVYYEEDSSTNMISVHSENIRPLPFGKGDLVEVKDWAEMLSQYGGDSETINCPVCFVSAMKDYCNREYIVRRIIARGKDYAIIEFENPGGTAGWTFTDHMVNKVDNRDFDTSAIDTFLKCIQIN